MLRELLSEGLSLVAEVARWVSDVAETAAIFVSRVGEDELDDRHSIPFEEFGRLTFPEGGVDPVWGRNPFRIGDVWPPSPYIGDVPPYPGEPTSVGTGGAPGTTYDSVGTGV